MMKMLNRKEDTRRAQKSPTHKIYIPTKIIGIKGEIEAFVVKDVRYWMCTFSSESEGKG